jgi:group I intron endonuclease
MGFIYCATNKHNGKRYVGKSSKTLDNVKKRHFGFARNGKTWKFSCAIRKYGESSFEWVIILDDLSKIEMNHFEIHFISRYDTYHNGYNSTPGGDGGMSRPKGWKMPESAKKKLRKPKSEETKRKISIARVRSCENPTLAMILGHRKTGYKLKGRIKSDATRKKLSNAHKGRRKTAEHIKKISNSLIGKTKGKTYEELYGPEKAAELKRKRSVSAKGRKRSDATRKKMSANRKGVSWNQRYGADRAADMRLAISTILKNSEAFQMGQKNKGRKKLAS